MILSVVTCIECAAGMHHLCGDDSCCCPDDPKELESLESTGLVIKNQKDGSEMLDPISTGRKRAALLYAIQPGQICEWAWHDFCGGGKEPVTGCSGRLATNIHHGPDKATINNRPDNVSVICSFCHNLWHGNNDKYYSGDRSAEGRKWLPDGEFHLLSERKPGDPGKILALEIRKKRPDIDYDKFNAKLAEWKSRTPK